MLCLLFNIRSPGAYKYLRNSSLLPLPHPKTEKSSVISENYLWIWPRFSKIISKKG